MFGGPDSRIVVGSATNSISAKRYFDTIEMAPEAKKAFLVSLIKSTSEGCIPEFLKRSKGEGNG